MSATVTHTHTHSQHTHTQSAMTSPRTLSAAISDVCVCVEPVANIFLQKFPPGYESVLYMFVWLSHLLFKSTTAALVCMCVYIRVCVCVGGGGGRGGPV